MLSQKIWNLLVLIDQKVFHWPPEEPREGQQVVYRGQTLSVLPLVDRLRVFKPEIGLNILDRQTGRLAAFLDHAAGFRKINDRECSYLRHKKTPSFSKRQN